jgi:DNA-binding NtrC family response regulator
MATVLVVDDNRDLRNILVEFLRHKGYQVHDAGSGDAAIKLLDSTPVDAVIADLYLPGDVTGIEVLLHHKKRVPTGCRILFTGALSDTLRSVCQYSDVAYLQKPVRLDQLIRTIESSLTPAQEP